MAHRSDRAVGDDFLPAERQLLELLCSGPAATSERARAHLASAAWGGYAFDDCQCFLIRADIDGDAPLIRHGGGPLAEADVEDESGSVGMLELWVVDGLLHSVDFIPWGDDHAELPDPERHRITLLDSPAQNG